MLLERPVPPDDAVVQVVHDQPVVERLEDVLVELAQALKLAGLELQLPVQPAVLERGRHLAADGRTAAPCLRCSAARPACAARARAPRSCPPSRRTARSSGRPRSRQNAISSAGNAPCSRGSSSDSAMPPARLAAICERAAQPGTARSPKPSARIDFEVAGCLVDEHQRHAIDDKRLANARDEPLAQAIEIEVAVQIAREADERAPIVVPVAIERAIERVLNRALHRADQQHDDERRQHRDDHVVPLRGAEEHDAGQAQQRRVNREDRQQRPRCRPGCA